MGIIYTKENIMKNINRLFCFHNYNTVTNLVGEMMNLYECKSIKRCSKCGKFLYLNNIDDNCYIFNFDLWIKNGRVSLLKKG